MTTPTQPVTAAEASDTPRTDERARPDPEDTAMRGDEIVSAEFARGLERTIEAMLAIECPWPESVWPMTESEYVAIIADENTRTAISGFLMRRGWEVAMRQIKEAS